MMRKDKGNGFLLKPSVRSRPIHQYLMLIPLLFMTTQFYAQRVGGKVMDEKGKGVAVIVRNVSRNESGASNRQGVFMIPAQVNDSISFSSMFFHEQVVLVTKEHFELGMRIRLKERVTELDEVDLEGYNAARKNADLEELIRDDMKKNPYAYEAPSSGNLDFLRIGKQVAGLFEKDKSRFISREDFSKLFEEEDYPFNNEVLVNIMGVSYDERSEFFEFCESLQLDRYFLTSNNSLLLLNELVLISERYKKMKEEEGKKR